MSGFYIKKLKVVGTGKEDAEVNLMVDPNVIERYYRMVKELNH